MNLKDIAVLVGLAEPGTTALKTTTEVIKNVKDLVAKPDPDVGALKKQIADLHDEILTTKQAYMALYDALLDLQQKEKKAQRFKTEAERYVMTRTEMGSTVYSLRPEYARGDTPHDLCATCFELEMKSILQPTARNTLSCGRCGGTFYKPDGQGSGIMVGRVRRPDFDGFI